MNDKLAVTEADLQAYVDGRLSSARHAEVEIYLAAHTADAERMAAYRQQNTALRKLFDPVLDEPIPDRLLDASHTAADIRRTSLVGHPHISYCCCRRMDRPRHTAGMESA